MIPILLGRGRRVLPFLLATCALSCGKSSELIFDQHARGEPPDSSAAPEDAAGESPADSEGGSTPLADAGDSEDAGREMDEAAPVHFACAEGDWKMSRVDVGEVTLEVACRAAATADGPLAVLLHGYPESHLAWNALATRLVAEGFVVVAPNQRGYVGSDKPDDVEAYQVERAADDLLGVLQASGRTRMLLVGHDWGGLVAFVFTHHHPERVHGLVVMNAPHPDIWGHREIDPVQADATDAYVPLILGPLGFVTPAYLDFSLSPHLSPDELTQYREQWNRPNAFAAMNRWYTANLSPVVTLPRDITIERPTLAIVGMDDQFVTPSELEHLPDYVSELEVARLSGVDHWITHQRTDEVAALVLSFHSRLALSPARQHN